MSLAPGTRIGSYEVASLLGEGGMGQVYRGRDSRLGRDVAIKILPEHVATDTERVARFEREAKTLATLNHPNIAQVYGFDNNALVMELVDGEDLSERIKRGPMPVEEALAIAKQIVDALDAAHGQGIIHRDLKPANIKIKDDGTVKVLDFGLAKAIDPVTTGPASGATITSPAMTMQGVILGTAAYMAPEQAKGRPVDKRADIWAFGCIVYEMVTGQRAFPGEDVSELIASVLKTEPDWSRVPAPVKPLLVSCLQKDPRLRLRDIGDARLLIDRLPDQATPLAIASAPIAVKVLAAASLIALLLSGVMLWRSRAVGVADAATVRTTLRFRPESPLQLGANQPSLAVSPDGKMVVYTAVGPEGSQLWTYSIDTFAPTPLAGTGGGDAPRNAFFSPDSRQIAYFSNTDLKRIPAGGGTVTVVADAPFAYGGTWTERDEIIFSAVSFSSSGTENGLWRVPASGGERRLIKAGIYSYPDALPGGRVVLASFLAPADARTSSDLPIGTVDIESGDARPLIPGGAYPRYAAGHVLFLRNGALMATPIDVNARTASDRAIVVVPDVFQNPAMVSGNYAVSPAGTLAYAPGTAADFNRGLVLIDAKGTRTAVTDDRRFFESPRLSPDGQRIAVTVSGWRDTIWIFDRVRGALTELTTGDQNGVTPVWTPDGTRVVFTTYPVDGPRNLHWMAVDGSGGPERLSTSEFVQRPNAWTPDGKTLLFDVRTAASLDLWTLTLDANRSTRPLLATRFNESNAALSPNGEWMAFQTNESGRPEVSLTRFRAASASGERGPTVEGRIQVSTDGGRAPVWSRDGRRLYYRTGTGAIMAVEVSAGSPPSLSRPVEIARLPPAPAARGDFDVLPDGRLLVVDNESAGGVVEELRIVVNWFDELKRKMAAGTPTPQ